MRHLPILLLAGALFLTLSACSPRVKLFEKSNMMMGTFIQITVVSASEKTADEALEAGFAEVKRLEDIFSIYRENTEFSEISRMAGIKPVSIGPESYELIMRGLEIGHLTEEGFNMAVGPAVRLWKVTESSRIPSEAELARIMPLVDPTKVILDPSKRTVFLKEKGMVLDPGGIAKGYTADKVEAVLKRKGIKSGIVAMAGDLKLFGKKPGGKEWRVAIKHPRKPGETLATLDLTDEAVSTSGDYERFFMKDGVRYHHILVPETLQPARECQSVTVVAPDGTTADALSTGIFVMGPRKGLALAERLPGIGAVIVDKDGNVLVSSSLRKRIHFE
ncbi:MAG TPA: FAD:protein FMN transferase [Nitrospiria bacterium]|nr:FAD:protein FMN transferase [Nitrospiria bacterium]